MKSLQEDLNNLENAINNFKKAFLENIVYFTKWYFIFILCAIVIAIISK